MFFLAAAVAASGARPNVCAWKEIEIVGSELFIAGVTGIVRILGFLAMRKAAQAL